MKFEIVIRAKWRDRDVVVLAALDFLVEASPDETIAIEAISEGIRTHAAKRELHGHFIDLRPVR